MSNPKKVLLGGGLLLMVGIAAGADITHLFQSIAGEATQTCEEIKEAISQNKGKVKACKDDDDCSNAGKFGWSCDSVYNRSPYRQEFEEMVGDYYDRGCPRMKAKCKARPSQRDLTECWEGRCRPGYNKSAQIRKQRIKALHKRIERRAKSAKQEPMKEKSAVNKQALEDAP